MTREAIVLAGGAGTRLRAVIGEAIPKAMAETTGKPFLALVLDRLAQQGVTRAVLSVGYRREVIEGHFGARYGALELAYANEDEPLGTGGAIRRSFELIHNTEAFVVNGDTLYLAPLKALAAFGRENRADVALALKPMADASRFGTVQLDPTGRVTTFAEKSPIRDTLINGGVYWMPRNDFAQLPKAFSFERDYFAPNASTGRLYGLVSDAYFIDIGTPEDYARAALSITRD